MGGSTSAVSKAKIHPRRHHFQCPAVLTELIFDWARHKIDDILLYTEIFNAAQAESSRLKPYCIRLSPAYMYGTRSQENEIQLDFSKSTQHVGLPFILNLHLFLHADCSAQSGAVFFS